MFWWFEYSIAFVEAYWWMLPIIGLISWLRLFTHEGAHALSALLLGGEVTEFDVTPWPVKKHKKLYWGYTGFRGLGGRYDPRRADFFIAPLIKSGVFAGVLTVALSWISFAGNAGSVWWWICLIAVVQEAADAWWWWRGYAKRRPRSDGGLYREIVDAINMKGVQ